jgi:PAS domain S-box-containing protein
MSEQAPVMIWMSDAEGRCLHLNRRLREFWGVGNADLATFDWGTTMHPDDAPRIGDAMMQATLGHASVEVEGRYRNADGDYRILRTDAQPRFSPAGAFLGMIGVNVDVTDSRLAEERLQVLVAELQHRTRNLLAVVRSLAGQSFDNSTTFADFREKFDGRLAALSRVQGALSEADRQSVSLDALVRMEIEALGGPETGVAIATSGPRIVVRSSVVQTLALALHELATNARKYGVLSGRGGTLDIDWRTLDVDGRPNVEIVWREVFREPNLASPPERRGYGRTLIEKALSYALSARTSYELRPEGVACRITIPADNLVRGLRSGKKHVEAV